MVMWGTCEWGKKIFSVWVKFPFECQTCVYMCVCVRLVIINYQQSIKGKQNFCERDYINKFLNGWRLINEWSVCWWRNYLCVFPDFHVKTDDVNFVSYLKFQFFSFFFINIKKFHQQAKFSQQVKSSSTKIIFVKALKKSCYFKSLIESHVYVYITHTICIANWSSS